ncbi:LysR family transcriptional regulator [Sphingobium sufflavum]|uniref:LysR family transcriptional regulator n=1 Tax=Sphingobium sufflavum TaxID=1129547 RepID=UPI001F19C579|nr:LysR family transcriptional regulator [Sphingobium sufflavum]MCE7795293.1 LysR family transcriptional regulator [Sphingobium sufflavum]
MLQLRSLNHLVTLAARRNFARAAEDLGLSQSALSRSIQALEAQIGMRLFDRDRAGVTLTPQGRMAVERAAVLLADADDFERHLAASASAEAGHVRFGIAPMPARALLPAVIAERLRVAPDVTNDVVVRDVDALWALLVAGEIEFFVTNEGFQCESPPPRIETLGHFPVGGIVRAGHPLLSGDCPGMTFPVVRSSWTGVPLPPEIEARRRGVANVIEDFGSLAAITAASDAIWFSSPYSAGEALRAGVLHQLPDGAPDAAVRVVMCSLERRSPSPWARSLKALLRQEIQRLARGAGG